jgi:hypothetical protein
VGIYSISRSVRLRHDPFTRKAEIAPTGLSLFQQSRSDHLREDLVSTCHELEVSKLIHDGYVWQVQRDLRSSA